ncbi:MAG: M56 family metallopeptidase [Bdellovibrionales bacterium]
MTLFFLVLAFGWLCVPVVEGLTLPAWSRIFAKAVDPTSRLKILKYRMIVTLLFALCLATGLLAWIYYSPPSHSYLPIGWVPPCVGHGVENGPGQITLTFLFATYLSLSFLLWFLFKPLPTLPAGTRRQDLEAKLKLRGVSAQVETFEKHEPSCFSEGIPQPRVLLLGGIEHKLSQVELDAVLDHEAAHLKFKDHQARLWARAYFRLLYFSPYSQAHFESFIHEQECRADDQAIAWNHDQRGPLYKAIRALATLDFSPGTEDCMGALGHSAWSVHQRLARLAQTPLPISPRARPSFWPFLILGMILFALSSRAGVCTLHCLIHALP